MVVVEATCNLDQQHICSQAVIEDRLSWLSSGGECVSKQYVQFTHLCSVNNYLPNVDYCCCRSGHYQALCCRYHQDWNHFRCLDTEDNVPTSYENSTDYFVDDFVDRIFDFPMQLFIFILSSLFLLFIFCLVCCLKGCFVDRCQKEDVTSSDDVIHDSTITNAAGALDGGCYIAENRSASSVSTAAFLSSSSAAATAAMANNCQGSSNSFHHHRHNYIDQNLSNIYQKQDLTFRSFSSRDVHHWTRGAGPEMVLPSAPDLSELPANTNCNAGEFYDHVQYERNYVTSLYHEDDVTTAGCVVLPNRYSSAIAIGPPNSRHCLPSHPLPHPLPSYPLGQQIYLYCEANPMNNSDQMTEWCHVCSKPKTRLKTSNASRHQTTTQASFGVFV